MNASAGYLNKIVRLLVDSDKKMLLAVLVDYFIQRIYGLLNFFFDLSFSDKNYSNVENSKSLLLEWQYRSEIEMPENVYTRSAIKYQQDTWLNADNKVETRFNYKAEILDSATVLTNAHSHVSVYGNDALYIERYSWYKKLKPIRKLYKKPSKKYRGVTLHLCTMAEAIKGNYAHWMIDVVSRYLLIAKFNDQIPEFDQYLIPTGNTAFKDIFNILGISESRLIELKPGVAVEFEHLVCTSNPRGYSSGICAGWIIEGYRSAVKPKYPFDKNTFKKIYVSRQDGHNRKIIQEKGLIRRLEEMGYKSLEMSNYTLEEKAGIFACAESVIGLTGAGMLNVLFCKPGTQIVELYPTNFVNYLYLSIAQFLKLDHHQFIFDSKTNVRNNNPFIGNLNIDVDDFSQFLLNEELIK